MNKKYRVKRGDTLNRIAREHGVNADAVAAMNGIDNRNFIRVDQVLDIPDKIFPVEPTALPIDHDFLVSLEFLDATNNPIEGLEVNVTVGEENRKFLTDSFGQLPLIEAPAQKEALIEVKNIAGTWKKITEIKAEKPVTHARIVSPKIKANSEMRVHDGPAQPSRPARRESIPIGTSTVTRSQNGHPVQNIALECPNRENLRLGPNAKFRNIIISAAARSGFTPQSIAAIMNAEAATISLLTKVPILDKKTRKPALDKDGKPKMKEVPRSTGEWDPRSASPKSSARGMTQFLDASWIDMALAEGTFLFERVKKEGWLTTTTITHRRGRRTISEEVAAFRLANGRLVTKSGNRTLVKVLAARPYVTARATASDLNLQKLLDLRYDPEFAINTAVDYGLQNLRGLKNDGFVLNSLSDGDKAKLIYLTHHLGLSDAKKFIKNTINADTARTLLEAQVGPERAAKYAEENENSYIKGHRAWLLNFVDQKIDLPAKMCDTSKFTGVRKLIDITLALR